MRIKKLENAGIMICVITFLLIAGQVVAGGIQEAEGEYPTRPIEIVVPYNPGGATDITSRILARGLEKQLPVPVSIRNVGGAAGTIGTSEVLRSGKPDGYTLLFNQGNLWTTKATGAVDFGPLDFEPVAQFGAGEFLFATQGDSQFDNMADVMDFLRDNPEGLTMATNFGTLMHFAILMLQDGAEGETEFHLVQIGDGAERLSEVLGGHIDVALFSTQEVRDYYTAGDLKVLAMTSDERSADFPDVPTLAELGIDTAFPVQQWQWLLMPPETPQDRVNYMAEAVGRVIADSSTREELARIGAAPVFRKGEELLEHMRNVGDVILDIAAGFDKAE